MPKIRNLGKHGRPRWNQAQKIIKRFGSEAKLAVLINRSRISVYRWQYARPYGTDGLIPTNAISAIKDVARANGILIRPEDWVPQKLVYDETGAATVLSAPIDIEGGLMELLG